MLSDTLSRVEFSGQPFRTTSIILTEPGFSEWMDQFVVFRKSATPCMPQMCIVNPSDILLRTWIRLSNRLSNVVCFHTQISERGGDDVHIVAFNSAAIELTIPSTFIHKDTFEAIILRLYSMTIINPHFALVNLDKLHDIRVLVYDLNEKECHRKLEAWHKNVFPYTIQISRIRSIARTKYNITKSGILHLKTAILS